MDPRIWTNLPDELLERVLSFLPLKTFLSLRSTCKHFKSLIFSPSFLSKHNSNSLSSFLLLSHPQCNRYLLYDTVLNTWRDFNLPLSLSLTSSPLLSTSSSLLFFSAVPNSSNSSFLMYNLLSRGSRVVKFPEYPFAFDLPTLITDSSGYKIFCLSSRSGSSVQAHLYDSTVRRWNRYPGFPGILDDSYHQEGILFDGCLYFSTREPFSVVRFDLYTGKWERSPTDLPEELMFVRLAAGNYRLFMFGGIGRNGISRSMKVWELERRGRKWVGYGS